MSKPLIAIDSVATKSTSPEVLKWVTTVGRALARSNSGPPRLWPYRHAGCEYLCCDYETLSITWAITGADTKLFDAKEAESDGGVEGEAFDMTDALMLSALLERARSGNIRVGLFPPE